jgi:hypothetical protein
MVRCASGYMLENPVNPALPRNVRHGVYYGDNVTGAENQQERLTEFRGWVVGFVDGEGCFSIGFVRQPDRTNRRGYKTGYQVSHRFVVTQGLKSIACLEQLLSFFGVGRIFINRRTDNHRDDLAQYIVDRRDDLIEVVIPFFHDFPMISSKQRDFEEVRDLRWARRERPASYAVRPHRDRGDRTDDEPNEAQTRADQNPQRPYARHPGHWMKIWSPLHGDMQGLHSKGSAIRAVSKCVRLERNSLSGKFRPARMA